jgi:phage baseplate assembly protein V
MSYFEVDDAIRSMLRRSRILKVDDSGTQQLVDVMNLAGDMPKAIYRQQPHGLSSNPPVNSEGFILALGGRSDRLLFLTGEHKDHRPKNLKSGETCVYDAFKKTIKLLEDKLVVDAAGQDVQVINAKTITAEASETITLKAPKIIFEGTVYLGSKDASRPVSAIGTVTTDGAVDVSNPLTKAFGV